MREFRWTIGSSVLLAVVACSATTIDSSPPGTPLQFTRLRSEPYSFTFNSGFDQPARLVIRDQAAWSAAWQKTFERSSPVPPVPDIDFDREVVVLVALGSHSTGGYSILIDGASATEDGTSVVVRSSAPGSSCGTTQAFTEPVDIARLPRRQGAVTFIERSEVHTCG